MDLETQVFHDDEIIKEDDSVGLIIDGEKVEQFEESEEEEDRGHPVAQILWKGHSYYLYQGKNINFGFFYDYIYEYFSFHFISFHLMYNNNR
jgi:hypothetical protein